MYLCMYICMYVCMYGWMYVCLFVCSYVFITCLYNVYMLQAHMCVCMYACMHKHVKILPTFSKSLRKHSLSSFFLDNVEEKECVRERLKALFKKRSKTKNLLRALSSTFIVKRKSVFARD